MFSVLFSVFLTIIVTIICLTTTVMAPLDPEVIVLPKEN